MSYEAWGEPDDDYRSVDQLINEGWISPDDYSKATIDVLNERLRQQDEEKWTPEGDDEHKLGELAQAAAAYAYYACTHGEEPFVREVRRAAEQMWPFPARWWKPKDQRRDLVRAAALIIAEIERIDRAAATAAKA